MSLCRHCHDEATSRPRGLGRRCYADLAIRGLYGVSRGGGTETWPVCGTCGCRIAGNRLTRCETCCRSPFLRPGYHARIRQYAERAERGEPLFELTPAE